MNKEQVEIVKSLRIIKDVCINSKNCECCPFSINSSCMIMEYSPGYWIINIDTSDKDWKAIK